ncbi:MAG: exopolysaccharide biosynthesis polyprenyl glycosylphosphotransferase [Frankiales bacterium]|jgi:exopolysaccharide biosynthesis polyprenyl glycosylphosphotransferase|nr:exopolysaccharide biosynthesis polyprenyl glycosylphosphotransferase [Frankiales bacterium]
MASTSRVRQLLPNGFRRSEPAARDRQPVDALALPLTGPPLEIEPPVQRAVDTVIEERRTPAWQRRLVHRLVVMDFLAGVLAAVVAVTLRFGQDIGQFYLLASVALPFVWVGACTSTRAYEPRFLGTGSEEFRRVFDAGVRLLALVALTSYAFKLDLARLYVLLALPLSVGLTLLLRYAARQWLHRMRASGRCLHKVIVVGRERSCAELVRQLRRESHAGFSVVGACVDRAQGETVEGVPVVGSSTTIVEALRRTGADTVAVGAWSDLTQADLRRLSWQLEGSGVDLVVAPSLTDIAGPRIHIRPVAGLPLLHIEEPEFGGGRRLLKGTVDRALALAAVLVLLPLLLSVSIAVRLNSGGPALFRQTRVGADGKTFTMFKFRSMYVDAEARLAELQDRNEAADGLLFKMKDDPRITPVGGWLRAFSLDELPQLLNIVRGDMSLVGPRPPLPREVEQYGDDVRRRLLVKPGLTGLWQISGRSDLSWDESVRLDLHYVENWSLALDAMILWKTVFAVVQRKGAY